MTVTPFLTMAFRKVRPVAVQIIKQCLSKSETQGRGARAGYALRHPETDDGGAVRPISVKTPIEYKPHSAEHFLQLDLQLHARSRRI
jgi:hypothetical protein